MKSMIVIMFCLVSILYSVSAEVIDGPANIRDEPSLEVFASLNDSCFVDANMRSQGWFYIERSAWVKVEYIQSKVDGEAVLTRESPLLDANGVIIGKTSKLVSLPILQDSGPLVELLVFGITNRNNIRTESIPEIEVEALTADVFDTPKQVKFEDFMARHRFERWNELDGDIDVFVKYKAEMMGSPGPRIMFLFQKGQLIAALFSEKVNLPNCTPERFLEMWLYFFDRSISEQNKTKETLEAALMGAD